MNVNAAAHQLHCAAHDLGMTDDERAALLVNREILPSADNYLWSNAGGITERDG